MLSSLKSLSDKLIHASDKAAATRGNLYKQRSRKNSGCLCFKINEAINLVPFVLRITTYSSIILSLRYWSMYMYSFNIRCAKRIVRLYIFNQLSCPGQIKPPYLFSVQFKRTLKQDAVNSYICWSN